MLYIISPELIYLIMGSLYLLTTFTHNNPPPFPPLTLATINLFSVPMSLFFFSDSTTKCANTVIFFL